MLLDCCYGFGDMGPGLAFNEGFDGELHDND